MSKQPAIIVDNVSMKFNLSKEKVAVSYTHLTLPTTERV